MFVNCYENYKVIDVLQTSFCKGFGHYFLQLTYKKTQKRVM